MFCSLMGWIRSLKNSMSGFVGWEKEKNTKREKKIDNWNFKNMKLFIRLFRTTKISNPDLILNFNFPRSIFIHYFV